jgi:hypothetical protein
MFMACSRHGTHFRHARPCAGHPRSLLLSAKQDVDGRDKPGHDGTGRIIRKHCHGMQRQIKPEQLSSLG